MVKLRSNLVTLCKIFKVQSRIKSIMGLPVIILVVALLVIVLRFVVVFLVIGLLK